MSSWVGDALFAVTAIPAAVGVEAFDAVAIAVGACPLLRVAGRLGVGVRGRGRAQRRGDDIVVGSLFGSVGGAPRQVRFHLFGALGVCLLVTVGTAAADPFGVLVPMLPLGLVGLWAARHGTFPLRTVGPRRP